MVVLTCLADRITHLPGNCLRVLYDQAVIAEGNQILDPADFAERVNRLMISALAK